MRISLLLCLFLTVTVSVFSVLANQSDPFKQNGSDTPKEIKTDILKRAYKGANIVSGLMSAGLATWIFFSGKEKSLSESAKIASGLFINVPAVLVDPDEKNPNMSTFLGASHMLGFFCNGVALIFNISKPEAVYFSIQTLFSLYSLTYKLYLGKKKQN